MKNIETILSEAGVELTEEQKKAVTDGVKENYKTIAEFEKQSAKIEGLEESLETTKGELKKFDGVDANELNNKIKELTEALEKQEQDHKDKIASMDFEALVKREIASIKGKNEKAIKALLDLDTIKSSKNQEKDLKSALEELTKQEDSKMLFGEAEPTPKGKVNPIGTVIKEDGKETLTLGGALAEHYGK